MLSEEQIIKRCIKGDRKAQKLLYDRYAGILLGVCIRYAKSTAEAEDMMQEGLIKVYRHIKEYSGAGSFINWMKAIMVNTAITYYHKEKKHQYHLDIDEIQETEVAGASFERADFTREELLDVIQSLPEGYRLVFNLYAVEGYKHKEIAEQLGIDVNTSKSQYSRARRLIREKLEALVKTAKKSK